MIKTDVVMYKEFKVKVELYGYVMVEDSKCPSDWRGSHCYDVPEKFFGDVELDVWAESLDRAKELVYEHEFAFNGPWYMDEVEDMTIVSIVEVPNKYDVADEEGIEDEVYGKCTEQELFEYA